MESSQSLGKEGNLCRLDAVPEKMLREMMVSIHRRLYGLGFGVGNDGNSSVRLDQGILLMSPKGLDKSTLLPQDIVTIDGHSGKVLEGKHDASSEWQMHAQIMLKNPDVQAIVHAHPPHAIACSLAGIPLDKPLLPEAIVALGPVPTCPYRRPGTRELAVESAEAMCTSQAIILERHGVVAKGKDLEDALTTLERVEHIAKIHFLAHQVRQPTPLDAAETKALRALASKA